MRDIDRGWKAIIKNLKELDGYHVDAGILKDSGNAKNGVSLTAVAIYNEFGTRKIPARPFVRIASDENRKAWGDIAADGVGKLIDRRIRAKRCCEMVGKRMKPDIQKIMGDKSKLAPNAPATIARKGHDKPLIDTGLMRKKVNFRVEK